MKVMQVNCVYKTGSTGKIVYDIHSYLRQQGIDSIVCYGRGKRITEDHVYKTCYEIESYISHLICNFKGLEYGACTLSTKRLEKVILKENPDIVHLHCINGYFVNIYKFITWLKERNIKCLLTLHAEFMHTGNCGHAFDCNKWKTGCGNCSVFKQATGSYFIDNTHKSWEKMKKAFDGYEQLTISSVSSWLRSRALESPILKSFPNYVILNGLDTSIFHFYDNIGQKYTFQNGENHIIFHATPFLSEDPNHIKGGYFVIELAKRMINKPYVFVIAGNYSKSMEVPKNVILLGRVSDQTELAQLYSMADLTLLTSKKETFSMITAESLCCGTPVVGFEAGAPEEITIKEYSRFSTYGNLDLLENNILEIIGNKYSHYDISHKAVIKYSQYAMSSNYINLYESLL